MTEAEFYLELAKLPAEGWKAQFRRVIMRVTVNACVIRLTAPPEIRDRLQTQYAFATSQVDFCPITALCLARRDRFFSLDDDKNAAYFLGIEEELAKRVVIAADGGRPSDPDTRSRLLTTLNLTDPTA